MYEELLILVALAAVVLSIPLCLAESGSDRREPPMIPARTMEELDAILPYAERNIYDPSINARDYRAYRRGVLREVAKYPPPRPQNRPGGRRLFGP